MVATRIGDHNERETDVAMANEVLAKVLCHNLCVLIQSHYELGINATFWGDEPAALPVISETAEADQVEMWAWV